MDYDDEREAADYVWRYYLSLMTDFECQVGGAIYARRLADMQPRNAAVAASRMKREYGPAVVAEIEATLAQGEEPFRLQVYHRLLQEHGQKLLINRCPHCCCVASTPAERRCRWCGQGWEESSIRNESG